MKYEKRRKNKLYRKDNRKVVKNNRKIIFRFTLDLRTFAKIIR